ncbi:MAG: pyridoxal phosphate-dependent aminotransferase, partial [Acutalibacteraceae bacterium]
FYPVFAEFFSVPYRTVPMKDDLSIDIDALIGAGGAVVIANPNAQTGLYLEPSEIERLASSVDAPVIVDEAYIDFGGESAVGLTRKYDNLLVTGTFSKSRNLAGARIGFAIGNRELIRDLNTLKFSFNPYNLNRISILAGSEALRDEGYFKECTEKIIMVREWFKKELSGLGFEVTDSMANFVLARSPSISGQSLYLALREKGILVRYLGDEIIKDYVRITIGTLEEMQTLIERIKEILTEAK